MVFVKINKKSLWTKQSLCELDKKTKFDNLFKKICEECSNEPNNPKRNPPLYQHNNMKNRYSKQLIFLKINCLLWHRFYFSDENQTRRTVFSAGEFTRNHFSVLRSAHPPPPYFSASFSVR